MLTKLLYITRPGEQPRDLLELELEQLPSPEENITHADRVYKVLERSFVIHIGDDLQRRMTCAMLVGQIAGPPHLMSGTPSLVGSLG